MQTEKRTSHRLAILTGALLATSMIAMPVFAATPQAGVAAAVSGNVTLMPADGSGPVALRSGAPIHVGDKVVTGDNGRLQVILMDAGVFTLGAEGNLGIDAFEKDVNGEGGRVSASIEKGPFRFSSGSVSGDDADIEISLQAAVLDVRGTILAGFSDPENSMVALVGPGSDSASDEDSGAVAILPKGAAVDQGEEGVLVYRAGFAVTVGADGEVSEPFRMSGREFGQMVAALARSRNDGDEGSEEDMASEDSDNMGDEVANEEQLEGAEGDLADLGDLEDSEEDADEEGLLALEEDLLDETEELAGSEAGQPISTIADLENLASPSGQYSATSISMANGGTFDFKMSFSAGLVDFLGFLNINTANVTNGELSHDGSGLSELKVANADFTTRTCANCEGSITVRNAGNGAAFKFFELQLTDDTTVATPDTYDGKLVRKGGNNSSIEELTVTGQK